MTLIRVISGGQTGADRAGLEAAKAAGLTTGGTVPRGWRTELGTDLSLRAFGVIEHSSSDYPPRTEANVLQSDGTLIIANSLDSGSGLTWRLCQKHNKPAMHISANFSVPIHEARSDGTPMSRVQAWLHENKISVLNVAGNRESKQPGLQASATRWLTQLFLMEKNDAQV